MPIVYYCRFLEFSIPTNIFQLLFCVAALFFALNRRSNLFIFCYSFLCLTLLISGIFFAGLLILNYQKFIIPAIDSILWHVLEKDAKFCELLEPRLDCKMTNGTDVDMIEQVCGHPRKNICHLECTEYLTSFLMSKSWLIGLIVEYSLVILTGIFVTVRAIRRRLCETDNLSTTRRPTYSIPSRTNGVEARPLVNN